MSRPFVSSPLAAAPEHHTPGTLKRITPQRQSSFPSSQALRPFPSLRAIQPPNKGTSNKPVKMIQPPADQRSMFVLNLTQAEFSRQD
ncbi:hypothetical protein VKT23_005784 [Stygiomarasmius scandens]|uniref:Uncharacterized protein n=1 Tax=Marasmiellus scandens TaxID=2682957 RepID=A0ABR1JNC8_9AGAR